VNYEKIYKYGNILLLLVVIGVLIYILSQAAISGINPQTWVNHKDVYTLYNTDDKSLIIHLSHQERNIGIMRLCNKTNSVAQTFSRNALLLYISPTDDDIYNLSVGDIIVYEDIDGEFIVHRIVRVIDNAGTPEFMVKGDNNNYIDSVIVKPDMVFAIIVGVIY